MNDRFEEWKEEIKRYCDNNGLSYTKVEQTAKCCNSNTLLLLHYDPKKGTNGLLDETPMPIVLQITRGENGPIFQQTVNTRKHLTQ